MNHLKEVYIDIRDEIFDALDAASLVDVEPLELESQLKDSVNILIEKKQLQISSLKRLDLVKALLDELKGLGPLQALVDNDDISDIMINGPSDIFIEINGKVEKSPIQFVNEKQLNTIAKRIASNVGRRIDESKPLCDARLEDGSRVNIVIPPLAIDGTSISIRKFKEQKSSWKTWFSLARCPLKWRSYFPLRATASATFLFQVVLVLVRRHY